MLSRLLGLSRDDTFGTVLARNRGVGPGFDVLRIGLALAIFIGHAKWVAGSQSLGAALSPLGLGATAAHATAMPQGQWIGWTLPIKIALVPAFFALSGFLVTGSALRLRRTSTFLAHRVLRIFPALIVEVVLSAFLLGAALTTLPLGAYFTDPTFLRYLGNMFGFVFFLLPGVFADNAATQAVNVNLWTLPSEFYCYVICAILMASGVMYRRTMVTAIVATLIVGSATMHFLYGLSNGTPYPSHVIVLYFLLGSLAYHWRSSITANPLFLLPAALASYALLLDPRFTYLAALPLTWLTMCVGMIAFPRFRLLSSGDYSYGIYLYGFPLCQALIAIVPWFYGRALAFTLASALLTALWAAFSWHVVEKRVLKLKRHLPERWFPTLPKERAAAARTA